MYESSLQSHSYPVAQQSYASEPSLQPNYQFFVHDGTLRDSQFDRPYLSESPSPVDPRSSSSYPADTNANQSQDMRSSQTSLSYLPHDRYNASPDVETDRYSRNIGSDKYSGGNNTLLQGAPIDQRRMSEPATLAPTNPYNDTQPLQRIQSQSNYNTSSLPIPRSSAYVNSLQRGASIGSLRDLRHVHPDYPQAQPSYIGWKGHRSHQAGSYHGNDGFGAPISPLQPDFTGGLGPREAGAPYSPTTETLYGTSPPGTGTSTSSLGPLSPAELFAHKNDINPNAGDNSNKTYSFVALPGNTVKKRPRRRYDEIERLYQCSWPDCNKAYGTLNHLNAHVTMQKHGPKRQPSEFKELRKQWRKAKKSASPGPVRRHSVSLRHDSQEYNTRRYDSQSESNLLLTRQPSYYASTGLPLIGPPVLPEPSNRISFSVERSRYAIDERDEHSAVYSTHERQRRSNSATWQGTPRPLPQQHYLSSSSSNQPSGFLQDGNTCFSSDTRGPSTQRSRSQSSLDPSMRRLPPDSTLLTPLPGYQSSLLPPLREDEHRDVPYPAETDYQIFDNGHDGRPNTGHRSLGDNEEEY
ncbi:hypothetical protein J132_06583 [Termitomyces sp. J132]|nr:hypothetical protein J132_06583 [Termitomyces sp. J132]